MGTETLINDIDQKVVFPETTEGDALRIFAKYIASMPDRFEFLKDDNKEIVSKNGKNKLVSDIHSLKKGYTKNGYGAIFADFVVIDKSKPKSKREVFFEIKGTSNTTSCWGGVTFKELKSAIDNVDNYYFAIICTNKSVKNHFIHPKRDDSDNPYGVFMNLKEFLQFSTRASLGIQFNVKYPKRNSVLVATKEGKKAYTMNDIRDILKNDFIRKTIEQNDHS